MTMPRTRLLARLFASEPKLVRLCAHPGYGKSSLARLFARRFDRSSFCSCAGITGAIDFAGHVMAALASESPDAGSATARTRLFLHATEADSAAWSRALLDAWKSGREHSLFVLEHAEAIGENGGVLALIGDMLATRPAERAILLSSSVALPLRCSHYLAPHQILTLGRDELRFDDEEAAAIFSGTDLAPETVRRIVRLARGWPIVLLLLALIAQYDANLEPSIERLESVPYESLHEVLVGDVLSEFTPEMMAAMLALASMPNASLEDVNAATGIRHATPVIERLLQLPGFVSSESGAYEMHPLLRAALRARHGVDPGSYLLRAARRYERAGDFLRAAELYVFSGDAATAAVVLDRLPVAELAEPNARLIDAMTKIETSALCAHPNLWIAMLPLRRQHVAASQLYDEAHRLLQSSTPESAALKRRLRLRLAGLAQRLEKLAEAQTLLDACGLSEPWDDAPDERRLALTTAALVAAKQGRFSQADAYVDEADATQHGGHHRFEAERKQIAREKARLLGDWQGVLKMAEEALYAARRSGMTSRIIDATRNLAWAAWDCDDDARAAAAREVLEDCDDTEFRSFERWVEAALSSAPVDAPAHLLPIVRWHAALIAADADRARALFAQALEEIDAIESAFARIAIRVCAALLLPSERRRLLEARVIAQYIESPPLQASLELLIDSTDPSDFGIFKPMAARVSRSPLKAHRERLHIDVARAQARRGGERLPVSDRGMELLLALAMLPAGTAKEELAAAIWPSLDAEASLNTLKMCVSRTRAQLADKEAILNTKRGYGLNDRVVVDVREIERLLRTVRGADALGDPMRRDMEDAARALEGRDRSWVSAMAWFAPYAAHLDDVQRELRLLLAKDAFRRDASTVLAPVVPTGA